VRLAAVTAALAVAAVVGLGAVSWGELAVPACCAVVGIGLFALSSLLVERAFVAAGGLLLVLAAVGALTALDSAGSAGPQGLVGYGAAVVVWAVGALRLGLLDELRARVRR
jgi:hypothetical protein